MKQIFGNKSIWLVGVALVAAALACTAPTGQGAATQAVGEVTSGGAPQVLVVTATPGTVLVVTATESGGAPPAPPAAATATTGSTCSYDSLYLSDVTIPDGSEEEVGATFTKTWQIKNNGCQVWPDGTLLVFTGNGNQMGGPASVPVPQTAVGGTQEVSVNLTAPGPAGDYQGYWRLRTPDGIQFGNTISVKIKSVNPPPAPGVTPTLHLFIPPGGFQLIPTPTLIAIGPLLPLLNANFTAGFNGVTTSCLGFGKIFWMKVSNTGGVALESYSAVFEAPPGTVVSGPSTVNAGFSNKGNCSGTDSSSIPTGGGAFVVGGVAISNIASGTHAKSSITMCGLDDLKGFCKTVVVTFNIP